MPIAKALRRLCTILLAVAFCAVGTTNPAPYKPQDSQQESAKKPAEKTQEKSQPSASDKSQAKPAPKLPAQIQLLETRVRFESNGDSRKEVHALVKINDELGARQFARLNFSYNRAFQSVEIPLARISHANGGTSDALPRAITDNPDPAVISFPAYQDIRVKSIRIVGLAPDDTFEYRVVTTTTHHPLAPDFWFEHTFDRSGVVSHEIFDVNVPAQLARTQMNDMIAASVQSVNGEASRQSFHWDLQSSDLGPNKEGDASPDFALTTFTSWSSLSRKIHMREVTGIAFVTTIYLDAGQRLGGTGGHTSLSELYRLVSQKIVTVDLPLVQSLPVLRGPQQILESGYGTSEEKARLLYVLATQTDAKIGFLMYGRGPALEKELPRPTLLLGTVLRAAEQNLVYFLDPGLEVAPFGLVSSDLRGRKALAIQDATSDRDDSLATLPRDLPFPSRQSVAVEATVASDGNLHAKARYVMRGDNELVLRLAFHQSPKEKWDGVAQLLALSDGFRGKVSNVSASDPYDTRGPFSASYEITQPKFVNWTKKPVRIPAILPVLGLPDPPAKTAAGAQPDPIELGTPLDVEVSVTVHLPAGTGAEVPAGTSVERDFATYESHYSVDGTTLTASRHINFILKEIPADRAAEYNAFLHAVQNDESQLFTLQPAENSPAQAKPEKK